MQCVYYLLSSPCTRMSILFTNISGSTQKECLVHAQQLFTEMIENIFVFQFSTNPSNYIKEKVFD